MIKEKHDSKEALARADAKAADPAVVAWMRRARKLMKEIPPGTWIYWQESSLNLMVEGPEKERYVNGEGGSDTASAIDYFHVPGSDAGGW